jgi:hypothetical protein
MLMPGVPVTLQLYFKSHRGDLGADLYEIFLELYSGFRWERLLSMSIYSGSCGGHTEDKHRCHFFRSSGQQSGRRARPKEKERPIKMTRTEGADRKKKPLNGKSSRPPIVIGGKYERDGRKRRRSAVQIQFASILCTSPLHLSICLSCRARYWCHPIVVHFQFSSQKKARISIFR